MDGVDAFAWIHMLYALGSSTTMLGKKSYSTHVEGLLASSQYRFEWEVGHIYGRFLKHDIPAKSGTLEKSINSRLPNVDWCVGDHTNYSKM